MAHGWTQERRDRQACLIRGWQPWTQSTGPKSAEGKARASQNSLKHGGRTASAIELHRELSELLRDLESPFEVPAAACASSGWSKFAQGTSLAPSK